MKYDLNKFAEEAKKEYWENAYKNKLKDIYHLEVALKWLKTKAGIESFGLEKATNGALQSEIDIASLKAELKFLESLMI